MRSRLVRLAPLAVAVVFLAALAGRLALPGQVLATRDVAQFHLPLRTALVELTSSGPPLWNPGLSGGQPVLSDPSYGAFYPATWLAAVVGPARSLSLQALLHLALALAGAWALARRLGCRPSTALVAALGYAGGGVVVSMASALNHLPGATALPWLLWATERWIREPERTVARRGLAGLAAIGGLALLNGEPVTTLCGGLATGAWWLARAPVPARRKSAAGLALAAATAAALAAVQLLPALSRFVGSSRAGGLAFEEAAAWSLPPARALELAVPRAFGDPGRVDEGLYFGWGIHDRDYPFLPSIHPGLVVLLLGVTGLAGRPIPGRGAWLAMAVGGTLLALGRHTPLYGWLHANLPPFGSLRYPEKFALLPAAALVFAAALALEHWLAEREAGRRGVGDLPVALAGVGWIVATVGVALVALAPERVGAWIFASATPPPGPGRLAAALDFYRLESLVGCALALGALLGMLALRSARPRASVVVVALVALLAVDLIRQHRDLLPVLPESAFAPPPLAVRLAERPGRLWSSATFDRSVEIQRLSGETAGRGVAARMERLEPWSALTWGIPYALSTDYAVTFTPPLRRAVERAHRLWAAADSEPLHRLLGAWGAAQLAIRTPGADLLAALAAGRPTPGAAVLRTNPFALALQRFVGTADAYADGEAALDAALGAGMPFHEREFLIAPPWRGARGFDPTARVLAASEHGDRVELVVETRAEALLVVATTFDPGWSAEADGRPLALLETAAGYQALVLPAGSRAVVLRYRERWLPVGAAVSAVAWLVLGALALAARRPGT